MRRPALSARFRRDASGGIAVVSAFALVAMMGAAAFGIDFGRLVLDKRKAQSAADLAALAAASNLTDAIALARATVASNAVATSTPVKVDFGTYTADPNVQASRRFQPASAPAANAVRVMLETRTQLTFGRVLTGLNSVPVNATATATSTAFTAFAIGSRLVKLDGGLLNQLLGGLLGANLSLTAMDYQSLLDARIDLFDLTDALATRARLTGPTYGSALGAKATVGDVIDAMVDAGRANPAIRSPALWALSATAYAARGSTAKVALGSLVDVGPYGDLPLGRKPALGATVSALDLLSAVAQVGNGQHQVSLGLDLKIPGLAAATLDLAIGERPVGSGWFAVGRQGVSVHTAQTRLLLRVQVAGTGPVSVLTLPLYVEIAEGTATLTGVRCGYPNIATSSATLGVSPGIVDAWIGAVSNSELTNFRAPVSPDPAALVDLGLVKVAARAHVTMSNTSARQVSFTYADMAARTKKTVTTTDFTSSLVAGLLGDLRLSARLAGLTVPVPPLVGPAVTASLGAVTVPLDQVLASILATLGIGLGQADVWVEGIRCDGAVLVD